MIEKGKISALQLAMMFYTSIMLLEFFFCQLWDIILLKEIIGLLRYCRLLLVL